MLEGEGVIFFILFPLSGFATLILVSFSWDDWLIASGRGESPGIVTSVSFNTPFVVFSCGVDSRCLFDFQLGIAVISTPRLVNFLVRVAVFNMSMCVRL